MLSSCLLLVLTLESQPHFSLQSCRLLLRSPFLGQDPGLLFGGDKNKEFRKENGRSLILTGAVLIFLLPILTVLKVEYFYTEQDSLGISHPASSCYPLTITQTSSEPGIGGLGVFPETFGLQQGLPRCSQVQNPFFHFCHVPHLLQGDEPTASWFTAVRRRVFPKIWRAVTFLQKGDTRRKAIIFAFSRHYEKRNRFYALSVLFRGASQGKYQLLAQKAASFTSCEHQNCINYTKGWESADGQIPLPCQLPDLASLMAGDVGICSSALSKDTPLPDSPSLHSVIVGKGCQASDMKQPLLPFASLPNSRSIPPHPRVFSPKGVTLPSPRRRSPFSPQAGGAACSLLPGISSKECNRFPSPPKKEIFLSLPPPPAALLLYDFRCYHEAHWMGAKVGFAMDQKRRELRLWACGPEPNIAPSPGREVQLSGLAPVGKPRGMYILLRLFPSPTSAGRCAFKRYYVHCSDSC
ncbi:hypothetical protein E2320_013375 [Naja naja]|nr:hypothetical protein E2320_013375 [Naja naja]